MKMLRLVCLFPFLNAIFSSTTPGKALSLNTCYSHTNKILSFGVRACSCETDNFQLWETSLCVFDRKMALKTPLKENVACIETDICGCSIIWLKWHQVQAPKWVSDARSATTQHIDLHAMSWFWSSIIFTAHFCIRGRFCEQSFHLVRQGEKTEICLLESVNQNTSSKNVGLTSLYSLNLPKQVNIHVTKGLLSKAKNFGNFYNLCVTQLSQVWFSF